MAGETPGFINQIGTNPQAAGRLVGALSETSAESLKKYLDQQLRVANEGMQSWAQGFAQNITVAQTSMVAFEAAAGKAFTGLGQGMDKHIAHTRLYSQSVSDSMEKALKSTLTALTSEAVVRAIYNTGLGFYFLAIQAYDQAAQAFEAAAVFGTVAGVAGAAGQAFSGSAAASSGGSQPAASKTTTTAQAQTAAGGTASPGGNLTVMVVGESQAATWLTQVINKGVEQQDLRLIASHTKRSAPAGR
jgi:hypothetical protein